MDPDLKTNLVLDKCFLHGMNFIKKIKYGKINCGLIVMNVLSYFYTFKQILENIDS